MKMLVENGLKLSEILSKLMKAYKVVCTSKTRVCKWAKHFREAVSLWKMICAVALPSPLMCVRLATTR